MGKILQIQVRAYTYNEDELFKQYPKTCLWVWEDYVKNPIENPYIKHGLLELVTELENKYNFTDFSSELKTKLQEPIKQIVLLKEKLEEALANWQAKEANNFSFELEDNLMNIEKIIKEYNQ